MSISPLAHKAYVYIQEQMLSGRLVAGNVVSEAEIAKAVGVSRTPVREAIRQLANEGLVEQKPRYGTVIRGLERDDIVELYGIREAIEGYAASVAAEYASPESLAEMSRYRDIMNLLARGDEAPNRAVLDQKAQSQFLAADMAFHLTVVRSVGNRRLLAIATETRMLSRLFRVGWTLYTYEVARGACEWHGKILAAIQQNDRTAAQALMIAHIRESKEVTLRNYDAARVSGSVISELPTEIQGELKAVEDLLAARGQ
jgi:DNA-binding GntR family transcriptional regulator